jgi:hypothetical protein
MFKKNKNNRQVSNQTTKRANVFSYYSSGEIPNSQKRSSFSTPDRSPRSFLIQLPFYMAIGAIIVSIGYLFSLSDDPRIIIESKPSSISRPRSIYEAVATDAVNSSLLNKTKLTINTQAIKQAIMTQFPEVKSVDVDISLLRHRPVVSLDIAPASLLLANKSGIFVIDSSGNAIIDGRDIDEQQALGLIAVADESQFEVKIGQRALTAAEVNFIRVLKQQLNAQQLELQSLTLPPVASELHARIVGQPYYVKFNLRLDPRESAGTFLAVHKKLVGEGTTPAEYIDVRVEAHAYYR